MINTHLYQFSKAIVKTPCRNFINGLTTAGLGLPDYYLAGEQHNGYIRALEGCGLAVTVLEADEDYPDSVFIEDTALLTPHCAIIMRPGAPSRKGEVDAISPVIRKYFERIEAIRSPGTMDAGDILRTDDCYFIGLSSRTNIDGAQQLISILGNYGLRSKTVPLQEMLHLKSGAAYLGHDTLVVTGELTNKPAFQRFNLVKIADRESYAANSIQINGTVILPDGYPKARRAIEKAGFNTIAVDVSEFQKLDGGISCLSLRF